MVDTVLIATTGAVARITINKPEVMNAFDETLIAALTDAFTRVGADPAVRAVVLTGNGRAFSAGADLNWMKRTADYSEEENVADARGLARLLKVIDRLGKPTIALVQGAAYGGGVGLVAACDIAIARPEAIFSLSEVRLGLLPAVISPYVVAAIGQRQARRYFLTGERFDAAEALRIGLVHAVAPSEALEMAAETLLHALSEGGPAAQAAIKKLIERVAHGAIDDAMIEDTAQRIAALRASPEGREGVRAFLEKRTPSWRAR